MHRIAPSILSTDPARLGEDVRTVIAAEADWIHFDVMDNRDVPKLGIGPAVAAALKPHRVRANGTKVPPDVRLMTQRVDAPGLAFADAGADAFVAGRAIFGSPNYGEVIDAMRAEPMSPVWKRAAR